MDGRRTAGAGRGHAAGATRPMTVATRPMTVATRPMTVATPPMTGPRRR